MQRIFGLSRDPFVPTFEDDLYCELPQRAEARRVALDLLENGRTVCICGPSGSGRGAFLERLAEDLALTGRSVLWAEVEPGASREQFLVDLLRAADGHISEDDSERLAEYLYEKLILEFERSGTLSVFPGRAPLGPSGALEASILHRLRLAGSPLVALALCGDAEPPLADAAIVGLTPFSPADLRDCLLHRASACGAPDLLSHEELHQVSVLSAGIGETLAAARRLVLRRLFTGIPPHTKTTAPRPSIFDPDELAEVGTLLEALAPARSP